MNAMEIRLLGPLDAIGAEGPLPLGPPRQKALLAVLALSAGRTVSAARIIEDLWGEDVPGSAPKMVQIAVSQLRKALPPGLILTRGPGYVLDLPARATDLGRFEGLLGSGREALAAGDPSTASELLGRALALWRGPALAEFSEPFAAGEARRLEEMRLVALEERIAADLALGRHADVAPELEALLARHPLRERLRGHVMLALYRSGRQAEALEAYQDARRVLSDELGIEPSEELRDLERRILRQDPALAPARRGSSGATAASAPPPRRASPIIGREADAGTLAERLARALRGERQIVVVSGEAGAGKTTLVEAFLRDPVVAAARVGHGRCMEQRGAAEPYMPVLEMLEGLCRAPGGESVVGLLVERAPTWMAQMPWLVGPDDLARVRERTLGATQQRMMREAVETVREMSADRPLVLVIEDLHWSDPSSLDLVAALARRSDPARLMLVVTVRSADAATRDHPVHAVVDELEPRGLCTLIALSPLGDDEVLQYLDARLPGAAVPDEAARILRGRTAGNPLFIEKAVDSWIEQGRVRSVGGGWRLEADAGELAWAVPSSVRQLIRQRLSSVSDDDRRLLEAAAVAAPEFGASLIADVSGIPDDEAEERCRALAADDVLLVRRGTETWPDGTITERFGFTHDLCHEVLYEDLPAGRRARLHAGLAARLERAHGDRAGEIATLLAGHFERAGDPVRAVRHLRTAASQALERLAPRDAAERAEAGLRLLEEMGPGDAEERLRIEMELRAVLGPAIVATRGWAADEAERAFARAGEIAERLGLAEEMSWSAYELATLYEIRGDYPRSERLMRDALQDGGRAPASPPLTDAYELLACSLFHQGEFAQALETAETGVARSGLAAANPLVTVYGDSPVIACHSWAALSLWFMGAVNTARDRSEGAVALARARGHQQGLTLALGQAAVVSQCRREPGLARESADECFDRAEREGFAYRMAMARTIRGWASVHLGDVEGGLRDLHEGLAESRRAGARMDEAHHLGLLADAHAAAGDATAAWAAVGQALAVVPRDGRFFWHAELLRLRGELRAGRGDVAGAEDDLHAALGVARTQGGRSLELRAAVSQARLLAGGPGGEDARRALAAVLSGTAEGAGTADVRDAVATLAGPSAADGLPTSAGAA